MVKPVKDEISTENFITSAPQHSIAEPCESAPDLKIEPENRHLSHWEPMETFITASS